MGSARSTVSVFESGLPTSRVPDPRSARPLRWGILGPGWISRNFVASLQANTVQEVTAIGSRSRENAEGFARDFGIAAAHASYAALVEDPGVDIVYVATPHNFHVEHALLAMEAGKHVLIEKPIALNSPDLERLYQAADAAGVMCQEAFWSFFLPKFDIIRQLVDDGALGQIVTVLADHGEWLPPDHRIHDPALAGGSLHDLGVYAFALSAWLVGQPETVRATGRMTSTGVMGDVAVALRSAGGAVSSLATTMLSTTPCRATIAGSEATLTTDDGFFFPGGFSVTHHLSGRTLRFEEPELRHGALFWEAAEVARRIHDGSFLAPAWTREHSRATTATLESVNRELGID